MHANLRLVFHYGLTIFLSAFLLFQVQPIIGKMILPWFGGSASVWTTCMLFFQVLLLLGYLYSHWIVRFLSPRGQSLLHVCLLAASLLVLPLAPSPDWRPTGAENPTIRILLLLAATIGLPYFVLSTTGPLIQAWFARERPGTVPYRLFALSNLGSLLALLAYPVAVEPVLVTRWQSYVWSSLFVCFALLCSLLAWRGRNAEVSHTTAHHENDPAPVGRDFVAWGALAACPSILMIADTSFLTENIAPIPLLWVVPLALYLLSFVLCFEGRGWYRRQIFLPLLVVSLGTLAYLPTMAIDALPIVQTTGINLAAFFVVCMVCHGELSRRRPHPAHLTGYYLMLATGGALGGVFVGVVAPYFFNSNYELSVGLVLTAVVVTFAVLPGHPFSDRRRRALSWAVAAVVTSAVLYVRVDDILDDLSNAEVTTRNFYGILRVFARGEGEDAYRTLLHGQIAHGRQFTSADRQDTPTAYYNPESGVGRAILAKAAQGPLRVGVVGLGVGTLASYGRPGDYFRLYEIDPLVIDLARSRFTYLSRTKAGTDIVLGDARLSLDREPPQKFDVLAVDAFSGDAVPIHLLTREAFATYFRHLKPDGVLAVHITNRFLDLQPVIKSAAESFGRQVRLVYFDGDSERLIFHSSWVLVSSEAGFFAQEQLRGAATEIEDRPGFRIWRDDYSSVFAVLK
jgi:SAM-dependent methyltransferase